MSPSGYVRVREVMLRENAPLAGEMSGHILFADCWHGTDDALFVAMRVLTALGRRGLSLAEFRAGLPRTFTTPEMRLPCREDRKHEVIEEVASRLGREGADLDTTDGLRVSTPQGWWLLRASGTEAKLTARCEAGDAAGLEHLKRRLNEQLLLSGVEMPADDQRAPETRRPPVHRFALRFAIWATLNLICVQRRLAGTWRVGISARFPSTPTAVTPGCLIGKSPVRCRQASAMRCS